MDLDQQIEALIDKAPPDGSTPQILKAIAPALILIAQQLQHAEYSILQAVDESWAIVVLSNLKQPGREKKVIYAFPTFQDASSAAAAGGDRVRPVPLPVTHILFQMIALEGLDSIVFFENPGNQEVGTEIPRQQVQDLINVYLQQYRSAPPPDIA